MKRLLAELAHRVISLLRSNRVAFRVKRTYVHRTFDVGEQSGDGLALAFNVFVG